MTSAAGRQNSGGGGRVSTMSKDWSEIKDLAAKNLMLLEEKSKSVALQNEKILQLSKNIEYVSDHLNITHNDFKVKIIMI